MTVRALFCRGRRYVVSGEGYDVRGEIEREDKSPGRDDLALVLRQSPFVMTVKSRMVLLLAIQWRVHFSSWSRREA